MLSVCGFKKGLYKGLLYLFADEKIETERKEAIYPRSPGKLMIYWKENNEFRGLGQFSIQVLYCLL